MEHLVAFKQETFKNVSRAMLKDKRDYLRQVSTFQ